jgi:predicted dehydrogenase
MPFKKLKTAVLGLNKIGCCLLETAANIDYFQVDSVADRDTKLAEDTAGKYNCLGYDDYRQLLMGNEFDCLLVAANIHSCIEHIRTAIENKINILKAAPPARDFAEAAQLVRLAENKKIIFSIANSRRFAKGWRAFHNYIRKDSIEKFFLATAKCSVIDGKRSSWESDPKLAGGGVLLHNCYGLIDQITRNFGLPNQVYSLMTSTASDRQQRHYLTEDAVIITMKFNDTFFCNVTVNRDFACSKELLNVYSKDNVFTVSGEEFVIGRGTERQINGSEDLVGDNRYWNELLSNFALSIISPAENRVCSSIRENLKNMAVIESAYLSARTGFPEEPSKILQMAEDEILNIWPNIK